MYIAGKSKNTSSSPVSGDIVAALHAGLEKNGQLNDPFDPSEYLPPSFEKDTTEYSFTELVTVPTADTIFGFELDEEQEFDKAVGLTHAEAQAFEGLENQLEVHLREKKSQEPETDSSTSNGTENNNGEIDDALPSSKNISPSRNYKSTLAKSDTRTHRLSDGNLESHPGFIDDAGNFSL